MAQDRFCRTNYQVVGDVDGAGELDLGSFRKIELDGQSVSQIDGLKNGSDLVIAIGSSVQNAQIEVQLGEGGDGNLHD